MPQKQDGLKLVRITEEERLRQEEEKGKKAALKKEISEKDLVKKRKYTKMIAITGGLFAAALITLAGLAARVLSSGMGIGILLAICIASVAVTRGNQRDK